MNHLSMAKVLLPNVAVGAVAIQLPHSLTTVAVVILLTGLFLPQPAFTMDLGTGDQQRRVVSVWSELLIESGDADSSTGIAAPRDCMRPNRIDCYSLQQNFWISDSQGNLRFWAQNIVLLAKWKNQTYYGTFGFEIWSNEKESGPLFCVPESSPTSGSCRAAFYTDAVQFPEPFTFYSNISNLEGNYTLEMLNGFGGIRWRFPASANCPCYIETILRGPLPWGSMPFEFVAVGLENAAVARFQSGTRGTFKPTLIHYADGSWHQANPATIHCVDEANCQMALSTAENSENLIWNITSGKFYWRMGALDQGISISSIKQIEAERPPLPEPRSETYLYIRFDCILCYLTVFDQEQRAAGIDPQSGRPVEEIPHSEIAFSIKYSVENSTELLLAPEEELLILNPEGVYEIVITASGNTAFNLFISKAENRAGLLVSHSLAGRISIGESQKFHTDAETVTLAESWQSTGGPISIAPIIIGLVTLVLVILWLLKWSRKITRRSVPGDAE